MSNVRPPAPDGYLFKLFVEKSREFLGISDLFGVPVYANQAALDMVGATDFEEVRQIPVPGYFVSEERAFVRDVILPTALGEGCWLGELHFEHLRTRESIPVFFHLDRVDDPATGKPTHFAARATDLRDHKRVEEALLESESRFRLAFSDAPAGMVLATPDGVVVDANQTYLDLLGYTLAEILARNSKNFTHPDDLDLTGRFFRSLRDTVGTRETMEKRYLRKDGQVRWTRVAASMRRDDDGTPNQIIAIIDDITDRKLAESLLAESQQHLRAIYDGTHECVFLLAPDGTLLEANRASLEFAGVERARVVGRPFWDTPWFTATPGATESARLAVESAANGKMVRYEPTLRRPSGEFSTLDIALHPVRNAEGGIVLILAEGRDVTDSRLTELRDAFLVRLDDATRPLVDAIGIMRAAAGLLGDHLRVDRCLYVEMEADNETFHVVVNATRGLPDMAGRFNLTSFGEEPARLLRANLPHIVHNAETDPNIADARDAYRGAGIAALINVSLVKAGRLVAGMAVHHATPRQWLQREVDLLQLVANRCWESIERARVTLALEASERRLRLSQKAGRIGSFEWLLKEDRVVWSPEQEDLFGLPAGGFEGRLEDWARRVVPDDAARVLDGVKVCLANKREEYEYEFQALLPDGTLRWLRGQSRFFYDENGVSDRMIGVNIDIHERKLAEIQLLQQWATLDAILSRTSDHAYIFDADCRFVYGNASALSLWGKSREESVGKTLRELGFGPDLVSDIDRDLLAVIATGQPIRGEADYIDPMGVDQSTEYNFTPVFDGDGNVKAVAGISRNMTPRKLAEQQELQRQEHFRETARLESLGIMASGIAHDFNNLLTGILGNASLLLDKSTGDSRERTVATEIMLAAERAAELTKQMLAYSGKGVFDVEAMDLNKLVQENFTFLRASLSRSVTVELDLSPAACCIDADRAQIQQVVMNLMLNASEAIGEHPGKVGIRTSLVKIESPRFSALLQSSIAPGSYALFEVRDDGSGMSADTLRKIFDPFFTTKFIGRGLGLAAVIGIVKGHKGDIEVFTRPGEGTVFRIFFPGSEREQLRRAAPPAPVALVSEGQTVLVVDDEEIVLAMATLLLESKGFRVLGAGNGLEALAVLRSHPDIAVTILDVTMPVMTGEQALPLIKGLAPGMPVILSSGFSEAEISRRFDGVGVAGFLQKPYSLEILVKKIHEALQYQALQQGPVGLAVER